MMLSRQQKSVLGVARTLSKWFQITIEIRLFGKLVWSYKWPPEVSQTSISPNLKFDEDFAPIVDGE